MRHILFLFLAFLSLPAVFAAPRSNPQSPSHLPAPPLDQPCPRFRPGSSLVAPQDLYSRHGILQLSLTYRTRVDSSGNVLFCFMTEDGHQSPTLHVSPGDELLITLKNALDPSTTPSFHNPAMHGMAAMPEFSISGPSHEASPDCGAMVMTDTSTNLHFHGTNTPPTCHQDEVIKTLINAGESFGYDVHLPLDEPPGLYWYHPHIHGTSEAAVLGGASGAIIVDGIENVNHEVAGLPTRTLILRDNLVPGTPTGDDIPAWDISLNYTPVAYPGYTPVRIPVRPSSREFWRVLNGSADTVLDLQVQYDGVPQELRIIAIDGVPTGSQDGTSEGKTLPANHFLLPPAARVEFILKTPSRAVRQATLLTRNVNTGPFGDNDPQRPIATLQPTDLTRIPLMPAVSAAPPLRMRFQGLAAEKPVRQRKLYFSEVLSDPTDPNSPTNFYITVDGATPTLFDPSNPPAIVTTQGSVEDWTIENRAPENHEFHIHQIHFLVLERDGKPVKGEYQDMVNLPYWSGSGPYPSVRLRMDFRGPDIGDFVYHCHILGHEDSGMMAIIRVLPRDNHIP